MRKVPITLGAFIALAAVLSILWLFAGRKVSLMADRVGTIRTSSVPVKLVAYEGSGTGGTLVVNDLRLDLTSVDAKTEPPHVGTTKDGEVALSFGGKVFPFGPMDPNSQNTDEKLAAVPQPGGIALIELSHSAIDWIEPFKINFLTGQSPSWLRHVYYRVVWERSSGAKLELIWRYEQHFHSGSGWGSSFMTRAGSTGLISLRLTNTNQ
ncbi:MAG: hypothetical protein ACREIW_14665 [Chthoniobacterales bacterium]